MDVALQVKETPLTLEMTGKFVVKVLVDAKGNYQNHLVLASPHWMVTERYVACLHLLKFEAATVAGRPKACWVVLPFSRCMR